MTSTVPVTDSSELCAACAHPLDIHDVTGRRYCAATLTMTRERGCICKIN